ncbi:MAG: peroxidase family protein, partial [Burkholderiales bacterium]
MNALVKCLLLTVVTTMIGACAAVTPQQAASDFKECAEMLAGGLRPLADERGLRFNGKVGDEVARCRGGDKAAEFRKTPFVDWSNYWATGDSASYLPGTKSIGGHLGPNGRGIDGALLDLEYQRMELIKFNLFDNNGTYAAFTNGRDGQPGPTLKTWPEMRLPKSAPQYAAVGGDGPQLCSGELIRFRNLDGSCNDIRNPLMGATGTLFARNVEFESTYPELGKNELARNRHGDRLSLLQPDPQLISRKLFTR